MLKGLITGGIVNTNSQGQSVLSLDAPTVYVNPYYIASRYDEPVLISKHYYMANQRIASALSHQADTTGFVPSAGYEEGNMSFSTDAIVVDIEASLDCLYGGEVDLDWEQMLAPVSLGEGILFNACDASEADISNPQTIVDTCACEQSTYWSEATGVNCSSLPIIYYYHPDYLGSVEFITDMRGDPYQFFFNTIWGENLQNQLAFNTTAFSSRFRFNGKEWDEETGNFYYGARYYDPKISVWLSVDPKAASFPAFTPYDMLLNNPLMMVDPGGDSTYTINSKGYVTAVDGIRYFREWGNEYVAVKPGEKYEGCGVEVSKVQSEDDPEKFIYVSKRAMEQRKKTNRVLSSDLNDKTDIYQFESEAEGRKYFEFAAKITGVEWSILAIGNGNNAAGGKDFYVGTSHTEDAEGLTGYFDLLGLQILWGDHSHPADGPLHKGDSETIPRLDKKNQAARFRVYFPFQDSYQEYNQNTLR